MLLSSFFDLYSDIAAVNSPGNVTLSGNAAEIDEIVAAMKEKGVFAQVSPPFLFHHPFISPPQNANTYQPILYQLHLVSIN